MVPALARTGAVTPMELAVTPASTVKTPALAPPAAPTSKTEAASSEA